LNNFLLHTSIKNNMDIKAEMNLNAEIFSRQYDEEKQLESIMRDACKKSDLIKYIDCDHIKIGIYHHFYLMFKMFPIISYEDDDCITHSDGTKMGRIVDHKKGYKSKLVWNDEEEIKYYKIDDRDEILAEIDRIVGLVVKSSSWIIW